jgi:hypothetical protein
MQVFAIPEPGDRVVVRHHEVEEEGVVLLYHWPTDTVRVFLMKHGPVWIDREEITAILPAHA